MTSPDTLKSAMRDALDANGTMSRIKSELRAAIFQKLSVSQQLDATAVDQQLHPAQPPENLIINELIKEYLSFNGLEHTLAVFQLEARVPDAPAPHNVLAAELNLAGAPSTVPLLYAMINEARLSKDMAS